MARVHEIPIASETREFDEGIRKGVIRPLEDAQDAFEDLERAASDTGRGSARDLDKLEDELKDVQRQSEKTERAVDDIGTSGGKGFGKLGDAASEVTQEVGQNLGEAVSSVRDNIGDLGQVGQDTLGGLAATLASTGPGGLVGAAALAAGAVGLGLITAEMERQQEEADRIRERLTDAYRAAAEEGRAYIDTADLVAEASDLMFNPERADEWKQLQQDANTLALDRQTIIAANAGDLDAQAAVQQAINAYLETEDAHAKNVYGTMSHLTDEAKNLQERWSTVVEVTAENSSKAQELVAVTQGWKKEVQQSRAELEKFAQQWAGIPKSQQLNLNVSSNFDRVFNEMARKANQGIRVTLRADGSQGRAWE